MSNFVDCFKSVGVALYKPDSPCSMLCGFQVSSDLIIVHQKVTSFKNDLWRRYVCTVRSNTRIYSWVASFGNLSISGRPHNGHRSISQSSSYCLATSDLMKGGITVLSLTRWALLPTSHAWIMIHAVCVSCHCSFLSCHRGAATVVGHIVSSSQKTALLTWLWAITSFLLIVCDDAMCNVCATMSESSK